MTSLNVDEDAVLAARPLPPNTTPPGGTASGAASQKPGGGNDAPAAGGDTVGPMDMGKMLGDLIGATCNNLVAPKRGPHWTVDAGEQAMLGEAYGAVMAKYFPAANFGPEVTAIIVTGMVFGPRVAQDKKQRQAPAAEAAIVDPDIAPKGTARKSKKKAAGAKKK